MLQYFLSWCPLSEFLKGRISLGGCLIFLHCFLMKNHKVFRCNRKIAHLSLMSVSECFDSWAFQIFISCTLESYKLTKDCPFHKSIYLLIDQLSLFFARKSNEAFWEQNSAFYHFYRQAIKIMPGPLSQKSSMEWVAVHHLGTNTYLYSYPPLALYIRRELII